MSWPFCPFSWPVPCSTLTKPTRPQKSRQLCSHKNGQWCPQLVFFKNWLFFCGHHCPFFCGHYCLFFCGRVGHQDAPSFANTLYRMHWRPILKLSSHRPADFLRIWVGIVSGWDYDHRRTQCADPKNGPLDCWRIVVSVRLCARNSPLRWPHTSLEFYLNLFYGCNVILSNAKNRILVFEKSKKENKTAKRSFSLNSFLKRSWSVSKAFRT